jgi:DNA-binding response OmpR family regulator
MTNPAFILVVDTDPGLRRLLDLILTRGGYHVEAVESPMEALGLVGERRPDLMILDIGPAEQHGATFVRLARRFGWQGPVIVLSADSGWRLAMREIEADADIRKPFSPEELLASVEGLLAEKERSVQGNGLPAGARFVSSAQSWPRLVGDPYKY